MSGNFKSLTRQLARDKRKLAVIVVLAVVLVVLWGRALLIGRSASAGAGSGSATQAITRTGSSFVKPISRRTVRVALPGELRRDFFDFDESGYPAKPIPEADKPKTRKSALPTADEVVTVEEQARQAVGQLTLQTTIGGTKPKAMISGRLMSIGDQINGLTLRTIGSMKVTLEMNGALVELEM